MPLKKRKRKWLRILGIAAATLLVLWIALPLWLPWVLPPIARKLGADYSRYERNGYRRLVLHDFTFTNRTIRLRVDRIDALTPGSWLWRSYIVRAQDPEPFARGTGVELRVIPTGRKVTSVHEQTAKVENTLKALERWLPAVVITNGALSVKQFAMSVPDLTWTHGRLRANVEVPGWTPHATVNADLSQGKPHNVLIRSDPLHLESAARLTFEAAGMEIQSTNFWWTNRIELNGRFAGSGLLPDALELNAPDFHFPAGLVRLKGYRDLNGSASATWRNGQFAVQVNASATPSQEQTNLPQLRLDLRARGNTNSAVIETAALASPGLQAELSREVNVYFTGPLLREPATLSLAADLSRLPWFEMHGTLSGEAQLAPGNGRLPIARFHLAGSGIGTPQLTAQTFAADGTLNWPWLEITNARAGFEDGSSGAIAGRMDLAGNAFEDGRLEVNGLLVRRWLPQEYSYDHLALSGTFHGPLTNPAHAGTLVATNVTSPFMRPVRLRAEWNGEELNFQQARVDLAAGDSSLELKGSVATGRETRIQLAALTLRTNNHTVLELAEPFALSVIAGPDTGWRLDSTLLELRGEAGGVRAQANVAWPAQGDIRVAMENLRPVWFNDFAVTNLPDVQIRKFDASAAWTNGPVIYALDALADGFGETNLPLAAELKLAGDQRGLTLSNFVVTSQSAPLAEARGFLPLTLHPGAVTNLVRLNSSEPMQFTARTRPHSLFWRKVTDWTGVVFREPHLALDLSGTPETPQGAITLQADRIQLPRAAVKPELDALRLEVRFDSRRIRVTEGQVRVQGQLATLTGEMPIEDDLRLWLTQRQVPDWRKASAHFRIEKAELGAFANLIPQILTPQGEFGLDLTLAPGGKLDGTLTIDGGRTHSLPGIGPIRDIAASLKFQDQTLLLQNAAAKIGGAPVTINGFADLRDLGWLQGKLPLFEFVINGTNVPLVRQPDVIIRSDLAVSVAKTNEAPPIISGVVRLRDSFFLSDLTALIPGRVAAPRQRPPYFSVQEPFLKDWRLALHGTGDEFMRIRTTLFNGEISANLDLQGTLQTPTLTGELRINSGVVRFPFATLRVEQGFVTLTTEDPFRPQITLTAKSRQFGFDIQMTASGPVTQPVIQFTSSPPVGSEQILLMITAGQLPRGRYTLTSQQRAQTVAVFVARDLFFKLGLGDDATQRLLIRSGEEITESGQPTYNVEYIITDDWSLVGEYDRFGDFNAGVKWRVYSK